MPSFRYYDLRNRAGSRDIALLFPDWRPGDERLLVLSPHDDDALLGAGYALAAAQAHGAAAYVAICCDGSAGYSRVEDRDTIVETRAGESRRAYAHLGLAPEQVIHLGYPDFSLVSYIGWRLSAGREGTLRSILAPLRELRITRLMTPNGYREHSDHEAAYDVGRYDGIQAGDPVLVDWAPLSPITSVLQYAVWGDFSPEDALVHGADPLIRANRAIVADRALEETIAEALGEWHSQQQIIQGLLAARRERACALGLMELYIALDPRPPLRYAPYAPLLQSIPVDE